MEKEEPAVGEVDLLGQDQVLDRLGQCDHLGIGSGALGDEVPRGGIDVDGVDAPVAPDEVAELDGDVPGPGADVDAAPARADSEPFKRGGERSTIDVVAQTLEFADGVARHDLKPGTSIWSRVRPDGVLLGGGNASRVREVNVTMLLADSAQVAEGKLYILGGGWSLTGPDPAPSAVAIKLEVGWNETGVEHHWELFLEDADGRPVMVPTPEGNQPVEIRGDLSVGQPEGILEGTPIDVPMAINMGPLPLLPGTRYTWRLLIDGEVLPGGAISFSTRAAPTE